MGLHYYYKDVASIGGNFSMQNTRDRERLNSIGAESVTYGDRVPNLPYTFGGADTTTLCKDVKGFRGNTPLSIYIKKGKIVEIKPLANKATVQVDGVTG